MKNLTASEARRNWFRILDEVLGGEVVSIQRGGCRVLICRDDDAPTPEGTPDYARIISASSIEDADAWGWEWRAPGGNGSEMTRR